MGLPLNIARRYLFAKKSHNVINVISAISAIGMAIGTAALILILSVYNGFDDLVRKNLSDLDPDILITASEGKFFDAGDPVFDRLAGDSRISGIRQVFSVPRDVLLNVLCDAEPAVILAHERDGRNSKSHIQLTGSASKMIRDFSRKQRRAFSKAMRDSFFWGDESIVLDADWGSDFMLYEKKVNGIVGGLCMSTDKVKGTEYEKISYSIHT